MGIFFVGYLCIGTHYRKYKITGTSFQRTIIEDDTLFKDKLIYLLNFNYEYCDKELTFMSPALQPGLYGCTDIVKCISVTDVKDNEISFVPDQKGEYDVEIQKDNESSFCSSGIIAGKDFKDIVKAINQEGDYDESFYIHETLYYLIDDKKTLPKSMKIYLDDKVIDCTVNNDNPVRIKNMVKIVTY